jgi:hypothetical protein
MIDTTSVVEELRTKVARQTWDLTDPMELAFDLPLIKHNLFPLTAVELDDGMYRLRSRTLSVVFESEPVQKDWYIYKLDMNRYRQFSFNLPAEKLDFILTYFNLPNILDEDGMFFDETYVGDEMVWDETGENSIAIRSITIQAQNGTVVPLEDVRFQLSGTINEGLPRDMYILIPAATMQALNASGNLRMFLYGTKRAFALDSFYNTNSIALPEDHLLKAVFINGMFVEFSENAELEANAYVHTHYIGEQGRLDAFTVPLDETTLYSSVISGKDYHIIHVPKATNPDNKIIYATKCDVFLVAVDPTANYKYRGVCLNAELDRNTIQLTHNDFAISVEAIESYLPHVVGENFCLLVLPHLAASAGHPTDVQYMESGLYDNTDAQIITYLKAPAAGNSKWYWTAQLLEDNVYIKLLKHTDPLAVTAYSFEQFVQAFGYLKVASLTGSKIITIQNTNNVSPAETIEQSFIIPSMFRGLALDLVIVGILDSGVSKLITPSNIEIVDNRLIFTADEQDIYDYYQVELFCKYEDSVTFVPAGSNRLVERKHEDYVLLKLVIPPTGLRYWQAVENDLSDILEHVVINDVGYIRFKPAYDTTHFALSFKYGFMHIKVDGELEDDFIPLEQSVTDVVASDGDVVQLARENQYDYMIGEFTIASNDYVKYHDDISKPNLSIDAGVTGMTSVLHGSVSISTGATGKLASPNNIGYRTDNIALIHYYVSPTISYLQSYNLANGIPEPLYEDAIAFGIDDFGYRHQDSTVICLTSDRHIRVLKQSGTSWVTLCSYEIPMAILPGSDLELTVVPDTEYVIIIDKTQIDPVDNCVVFRCDYAPMSDVVNIEPVAYPTLEGGYIQQVLVDHVRGGVHLVGVDELDHLLMLGKLNLDTLTVVHTSAPLSIYYNAIVQDDLILLQHHQNDSVVTRIQYNPVSGYSILGYVILPIPTGTIKLYPGGRGTFITYTSGDSKFNIHVWNGTSYTKYSADTELTAVYSVELYLTIANETATVRLLATGNIAGDTNRYLEASTLTFDVPALAGTKEDAYSLMSRDVPHPACYYIGGMDVHDGVKMVINLNDGMLNLHNGRRNMLFGLRLSYAYDQNFMPGDNGLFNTINHWKEVSLVDMGTSPSHDSQLSGDRVRAEYEISNAAYLHHRVSSLAVGDTVHEIDWSKQPGGSYFIWLNQLVGAETKLELTMSCPEGTTKRLAKVELFAVKQGSVLGSVPRKIPFLGNIYTRVFNRGVELVENVDYTLTNIVQDGVVKYGVRLINMAITRGVDAFELEVFASRDVVIAHSLNHVQNGTIIAKPDITGGAVSNYYPPSKLVAPTPIHRLTASSVYSSIYSPDNVRDHLNQSTLFVTNDHKVEPGNAWLVAELEQETAFSSIVLYIPTKYGAQPVTMTRIKISLLDKSGAIIGVYFQAINVSSMQKGYTSFSIPDNLGNPTTQTIAPFVVIKSVRIELLDDPAAANRVLALYGLMIRTQSPLYIDSYERYLEATGFTRYVHDSNTVLSLPTTEVDSYNKRYAVTAIPAEQYSLYQKSDTRAMIRMENVIRDLAYPDQGVPVMVNALTLDTDNVVDAVDIIEIVRIISDDFYDPETNPLYEVNLTVTSVKLVAFMAANNIPVFSKEWLNTKLYVLNVMPKGMTWSSLTANQQTVVQNLMTILYLGYTRYTPA